ncbi:MAG: hypothetical protein COS89_00885 [Deltaproteobacteria bacterium CG07_land_8_20_14_0_80_38_7]|nr:MAG: hypothetical protein COS89_00885 [Deltaproteobacteria bacterium CG07_land_8_20_14_0_80_38_7]
MSQKIDQDVGRFKAIIKGRVKKELRKFISNGELIGKKGKGLVSIPIPRIDIPRFVYSDKQAGGVGEGEGDAGQTVGQGEPQAGNLPGQHIMEVDVSLEELAEMLGEELELPNIKQKSQDELESFGIKYSGIAPVGPESLRHFKRTYRKALKRQIMSGTYDPRKPLVVPTHEDRVYRTWKEIKRRQAKALIIYILDVSGSMGMEQKEIVRLESFWIDTWIRSQYQGVEVRYIVHDAVAREVDQETFFHTRESGGTIISSAYKTMLELIDENYDVENWNIYPFQFSDGDNWSGNDTEECLNLLTEKILPICNMFCYGQVESEYGSGQFLKDLEARFKGKEDKIITSKIPNRDAIIDSIKTFLGKGN